MAPAAAGPLGARFTNERVEPMSDLKNDYPWKALGKLFLRGAGGGNFVCSATVVHYRVVATAGHCVYDAQRRQFNGEFLFVPGFHNGDAPFGTFGYRWVATTPSWGNGGGGVPNAADFGILVMNDVVADGRSQRLGELVGWLGWKTFALEGNHVTLHGYPGNLDGGQHLQRTSAQVFRTASPNSAEIGSDMAGGSSGGSWTQDFGIASGGQPAREGNGNVVVGIQSYGIVGQRVSGSSVLNGEWVQIWDLACNQGPGNCG